MNDLIIAKIQLEELAEIYSKQSQFLEESLLSEIKSLIQKMEKARTDLQKAQSSAPEQVSLSNETENLPNVLFNLHTGSEMHSKLNLVVNKDTLEIYPL